jgi:O-antigen/teichoic acid export membrane protein
VGLLAKVFAPEQKSVSAKVVRNVLFSVLRSIVVLPIPFLLIRFILGKIGISDYGVYAVFLTVIGFTALSDLGMAATLTKHVAEHYTKGDFPALKRLLDTGLMFYLLVGLFLISVLWAASGWLLPALFRNMSVPFHELRHLWLVIILATGVNLLGAPFSSVIVGLQRMDLGSVLGFVNVVANAVFTVLFLSFGWHLRGLVYANLAGALLGLALQAGFVHKLLPNVSVNPLRFDRQEMKEVFSFSWRIYTTQIASTVQGQIEKVYLAWLVGVMPVGWYNIASDAGMKVRRVPELLLSPVMAAASELDARGDEARLKELYYRAHKYIAFLSIPLVVLAAVLCRQFVNLWLGPQLIVVAVPFALLVLTNILNLITGPGFLISIGRGELSLGVKTCVAGTMLNLLISFFLIRFYGFSGAVVGTIASATFGMIYFMYLFHRYAGYPYKRLFTESYVKTLAAGLVGAVACFPISSLRPFGWGGLVLEVMVFGVVYLLALFIAKFFDEFDLTQAARLSPVFRLLNGVPSGR